MKPSEILTKRCEHQSLLEAKLRRINANIPAIMDEMEKCKDSPAYFYNNYMRKPGERMITDEEINNCNKQLDI